jgi:hypothetical protein
VISEVQKITGDPSLVPAHSDLTQLWRALQALLAKKYITTHITKTVHGAGADFPDLNSAMMWVSEYTITSTGYVTFLVAPGKWTYTSSVYIDHQNANRIAIQGGALLGAAPVPGNLSCTGWGATAQANDGSNQIIYLRSVFATELAFTGGKTGFQVYTREITLRYLLITGSQTIDTSNPQEKGGCGIFAYDDLRVDCIAVWGFGDVGINLDNSTLRFQSSLSITVCFCKSHGVSLLNGAWISEHNSHSIFKSCGNSGFRLVGGHGYFAKVTCAGCGGTSANAPQPGMDVFEGGVVMAENWITCELNAHSGAAAYAGYINSRYQGGWFINNGVYGIYLESSGAVLPNNTFQGNGGGYSVVGLYGSNAMLIGSFVGQPLSPLQNTVGNYNSYNAL